MFGEVLPYLNVIKNQYAEQYEKVVVPQVTGLKVKEAKEKLEECGLGVEFNEENFDAENAIIVDQLPKQGITLNSGTKVILYTN